MIDVRTRAIHVLALTVSTAVSLSAQVPIHGRKLNPTDGFVAPVIVQVADDVHVFAIGSTGALRHSRSRDGTRTWDRIEQGIHTAAPSQAPLPYAYTHREVATTVTDSGALIVAREGLSQMFVLRSDDQGDTWTETPLATSPLYGSFGDAMQPALHSDGSDVLLVWANRPAVFASRSSDDGVTWQTPVRIDSGGIAGLHANSVDVSLVADGGSAQVYYVFEYASSGMTNYPTYRQETNDMGVSWLATPPVANGTSLTSVAASGGAALAGGVGLHLSANNGVTWSTVTTGQPGYVRDVAMDGTAMAFVRNGNTFEIGASFDGGTTWQLAAAPWSVWPSESPSVHTVDGVAYAWIPEGFVYRNDGSGWVQLPGLVHLCVDPGPRRNVHLARSFVSQSDAWAFAGTGYSPLGSGTAGTGGITPTLRASGSPLRGETFSLDVAQAVPASLGVLAVSQPQAAFAPPTPVPLGAAELYVTSPAATVVFPTGAGTWSLPVAVPTFGSLIGVGMTCQAVILDPAAPSGLGTTNAIEVWLR